MQNTIEAYKAASPRLFLMGIQPELDHEGKLVCDFTALNMRLTYSLKPGQQAVRLELIETYSKGR